MSPHTRPSLLAVALALALPAWSASESSEQYSRLPESVQRVERDTGGKVLQVMPIQRGDREVYRMKVLTPDGRIRVIQDDPRHPRDPASDDTRDAPAERAAGRDRD